MLIAAVLGGLRRPAGAYAGAFVFTVVQSFAIKLVDPERFNTVIGLVFIAVVVFSPDGIIGMSSAIRRAVRTAAFKSGTVDPQAARDGGQIQKAGGNSHVHSR